MKTILNKLLYLGTQKLSDPADEKYIVLTNGFLLVFFLFPISYTPYLYFYSIDKWIIIVIFLKAFGYFLSYPLNYFGFHTPSKLIFAFVNIVGTVFLVVLMGNQINGQLFLLPVLFLPFVIYSPSEKFAMYFHIILLISVIILLEFGIFGNDPLYVDPEFINKLQYHNFLLMSLLVVAAGVYVRFVLRKAEIQLDNEIEKSDNLLLNILPESIAAKLKESHESLAEQFDDATILFADIVGFTKRSESMQPNDLVAMLDDIFSEFDKLADKYAVEKIKTIGDAYMVVGGVPEQRSEHCEIIAELALEMQDIIHEKFADKYDELDLRIGIHSGSVVAGVIGSKKFSYDLWGDSVNTAARMESHGIPGKIQVTKAIFDLLKNKYNFERRGEIEIKGKGLMETYFLEGKSKI